MINTRTKERIVFFPVAYIAEAYLISDVLLESIQRGFKNKIVLC